MYLADASDATRCKAFPTTLSKAAMKWFDSLPPRRSKNLYVTTWKGSTKRVLEIQDLPIKAFIMWLVNGLREGPFSQSISKRHPTSLSDIQERAKKYINIEENARLREPSWRQGPPHSAKEKEREPKKKEEVGLDKPRRYHSYTPLKISLVDVYREICNTERLPPPRPIKNKKRRSRGDHCEYHKMYGHSTNDCYDLKNVIERLAKEGRLDRYLMERSENSGKRKRDDEDMRDPPPQTPERHIHTISGGFVGRGLTKSSRKRHLKRVYQVGNESPDLPTISFTKEDGQGIMPGHDDAVVITMILANANLHRTLVDQGSSADILFKPAFDKLGLDERELKAYPDTLYGLGDMPIKPLGYIPLHTTFGKGKNSKTLSIDFIVIDVGSAYNALIGRTTLNRLGAVVLTPHLCMKFPTHKGIATVREDKKLERKCYNESLNLRGKSKEVHTIEFGGIKAREELRPQSGGRTEEVQISKEEGKNTNIGASLDRDLKQRLIKLLRDNSDLFARKASDMPGIDPQLMSHKLSVHPGSRPVQQRRRKLGTERARVVEEQVQTLLEADFIREVKYPAWLANVVLVKKQNGKWRMCVDYTDLNKACPKDPYALPCIDTLVNAISGYQYLSFMDAYLGYNKIPMLMNKVFAPHLGSLIEVYVDDMLVKTKEETDLLTDLSQVLDIVRSHGMRLNPTKCTFAVEAGKFLGFMLTQRGIEANSDKCKVILEMRSPTCLKEVQQLNGRLAALSRFLAGSTLRYLPLFSLLRKGCQFEWTPECEEAFREFKKFLSQPPILTRPIVGEELVLYLSVADRAIASALIREDEVGQHLVYFTSKVLQGPKLKYQKLEKFAYSLVVASRRLRPYFQAHTIKVRTNQPMKQVLQKTDIAGRMVQWAIELSEFDLKYEARTAIKAQCLTDFLVEYAGDQEEKSTTWELYVDGSSNKVGSGAGIILVGEGGMQIEVSLKFKFPASNNQAEYEALIAGLKLAKEVGATKVMIFSDSQVVTSQINGEY
ncbi:uncharacterized protein LOC107464291 [Arachis duranensis]|uniref:Uncharacterized protein LOC107464291 n=1 Tax=Arachis duranensis TaxID=130453 RepID=A0A6P4BJF3_ARADU|nr:uncharacterized protein LOC107464291 [Arachis duranensis]